MVKLKNDANQKIRDLGKGHLATKKVLEEIDQQYNIINENQHTKDEMEESLNELVRRRDDFPKQWRNSNELHGGELPLAYLNLMLKYEILL